MLVLSLRRGESFYVGDQKVTLVDFNPQEACLKTGDARVWMKGSELVDLPGDASQFGVRVSAGKLTEGALRVGIDAPYEVEVLREKLYRRVASSKPKPKRGSRRYHQRAMHCRHCKGLMKVPMDGRMVPCPAAQNPSLPICDEQG